ncbi:DUF397 domain-containing protein [Streptomyces caniscabiei]|uniref:DUF397 domain-containing protein n=1 Tax=Streptomyces caniscabiei TaxID=2746961 RepID=UPI0018730516|nr:DUF397 domain-containing protein [Streptomyces caniscabiei]MBE4754000.1 DUF397 domain-containing protein [Streptomyces caniscabiei]MBE4767593.1 DUF397 domain-containing protein [Streptomyces caniscabiei]MBE4784051.1 DUF397 domain-containing protein [Streptomyces caniscabiei]MBE4791450.1 DUF397 domain-containing protein [Streptomyces caniscabiei]
MLFTRASEFAAWAGGVGLGRVPFPAVFLGGDRQAHRNPRFRTPVRGRFRAATTGPRRPTRGPGGGGAVRRTRPAAARAAGSWGRAGISPARAGSSSARRGALGARSGRGPRTAARCRGPAGRAARCAGTAVEVATGLGVVHVRDSKNQCGPQLALAPDAWAEFVEYASDS